MSKKYKIAQLSRYGNIIYYAQKTKETFEITVLEIIKDKKLIDAFSAPDKRYLMSLRKLYKTSHYDGGKNL